MSKPKHFRASSLELLKLALAEYVLDRAQQVIKSTIANRAQIASELTDLSHTIAHSNFTLSDKFRADAKSDEDVASVLDVKQ